MSSTFRRKYVATFLILTSYTISSIIAFDTQTHLQQHETKRRTSDTPLTISWQLDRNHYAGPLLPHFQSPSQQRTCIIVQDSAPGPEVEVLDATSRVNRAYAKRWNHDYLRFTGVALGSEVWQATFNKPFLLSNLLRARAEEEERHSGSVTGTRFLLGQEELTNSTLPYDGSTNTISSHRHLRDMEKLLPYDTVLFLDSNAMIVQLDYDVLELIAQDKMLAMVDGGGKIQQTKNSDVMMWNLAHPQVKSISESWIERAQINLNDEKANSQALLMNVLNSINSQSANLVDPIPEPMVDGLQGTVIKQDSKYTKHVVEQSDLPQIMPVVQGIADSVCYRFYPQCEVV